MTATVLLAHDVGIRAACSALTVSRAGFYRWRSPVHEKAARPKPPLALSSSERCEVLDLLHGDRFVDTPLKRSMQPSWMKRDTSALSVRCTGSWKTKRN
jgi:hypothetical protein